jgi:hypothetical protein
MRCRNSLRKVPLLRLLIVKNEFISNIFLVPKKNGDFRLVINLKPRNHFVDKIHFKMENIQMVLNAISPGDYIVSLRTLRMLIF